ncbi:Bro-N domain-containing protein [Saccharopolyspora sp. NPDC050389]|uniref:BRO-N domain-containing protein n=1 Tax=Saccharopolyspora sp. NPDC050389 TaxID=3155516 RepID=UPI0034017435
MSEILPFAYQEHHVRALIRDDEPWFVAADVAAVLQLGSPRSSLALLDEDEKGVHSIDTLGGVQQVSIINEPGLYSLILRSRKQEAKQFKRWITHEVLPSIRRTGRFAVVGQAADPRLEPHTLTWDEAAALMRQRYGIDLDTTELCRLLRTAGVLKQNGSPRKPWRDLFWFTGSAWTIHPHALVRLASRAAEVGRELRDFRMLQMQLEYDTRFGALNPADRDAA